MSVSVQALVLLALLGFGVGTFGTLVGAGGGFILTPVLLVLYPASSAVTITSISLVVVFFNALSGSIAYARQRRIDYRSGIAFAAAAVPGSVIGALVVGFAPRRLFDALTGVLLAVAAVVLFREQRNAPKPRDHVRGSSRRISDREGTVYAYRVNVRRGILYSVVVGFVSSFLGIGGGIIHVPLMVTVLGIPVHVATATSHFVLVNMAAVGSITHIATGAFSNGVGVHRALALSAGVVIGAQIGALVSGRIRGPVIQGLLAVAVTGLAVRLLVGAV